MDNFTPTAAEQCFDLESREREAADGPAIADIAGDQAAFDRWLENPAWVADNIGSDLLDYLGDIPISWMVARLVRLLDMDACDADFRAADALGNSGIEGAYAMLPYVGKDPETFGSLIAEAAAGCDDTFLGRSLWEALSHDPILLQECMTRLADR